MAKNRSKVQRELDRQTIAKLSLQGWSQLDIAQHLEVDQATVSRDLKAIQQQWKDSTIRDFDLDRHRELEKLAIVEKEYWLAWERSQVDKEISLNEKLATGRDEAGSTLGRVKLATRTEQKIGEPAYLGGIVNVIRERSKLLGVYPQATVLKPDSQPEQSMKDYLAYLQERNGDSTHR